MYRIGNLVTRKSYNNDIIFKIVDIVEDNYILQGYFVRLYADAKEEDLNLVNGDVTNDFEPDINEYRTLDRNEYFYLPGKVLHIDGDEDYLERCMDFYKQVHVKAIGFKAREEDISNHIKKLLDEYNPDILVITGHDAYYKKLGNESNNDNYKNTSNFIKGVKEARKYYDHNRLIIIAGACQSNYEELIKAGANFASSPKRINIHALDPAIIASSVALSDKSKPIDLINILEKTKYGSKGIGGIITNGTMYVGYPR